MNELPFLLPDLGFDDLVFFPALIDRGVDIGVVNPFLVAFLKQGVPHCLFQVASFICIACIVLSVAYSLSRLW